MGATDTTVKRLPRNFSDSHTIQLHLKRKMEYMHNYMCETIRPQRVRRAVEYLIPIPLYSSEATLMSDGWIENFEKMDETQEVPFRSWRRR